MIEIKKPKTIAKRRVIKYIAKAKQVSLSVAAHIYACKPNKEQKRLRSTVGITNEH